MPESLTEYIGICTVRLMMSHVKYWLHVSVQREPY
jgi:hypothetical protein